MVGCHHRLNGHEFEQTPGDSGGQGSLACGSPWGSKEPDLTQQLKNKQNQVFDQAFSWDIRGWRESFLLSNVSCRCFFFKAMMGKEADREVVDLILYRWQLCTTQHYMIRLSATDQLLNVYNLLFLFLFDEMFSAELDSNRPGRK